jgi:short-subunit dehydrogenase
MSSVVKARLGDVTLAMVTGASAGIGAGFANRFARLGHDLVLVARDKTRLEAAAAHLAERWQVSVEVLPADLGTDDGCAAVEDRLRDADRPVDVLVNNAGFSLGRDFLDSDVDDEELMLRVMVRAPMRLTKAALGGMLERDRGSIITVASTAGLVPYTTYGAAKAWAIAFSKVVGLQVAGTGVRTIALCPGLVRTEFHQRAGIDVSRVPPFMWLDADRVVDECLRDLARGRRISNPSRRYRLLIGAGRMLPTRLTAAVVRRRGFRSP